MTCIPPGAKAYKFLDSHLRLGHLDLPAPYVSLPNLPASAVLAQTPVYYTVDFLFFFQKIDSSNMNMIDNRTIIEATIEYIEKTNRLN